MIINEKSLRSSTQPGASARVKIQNPFQDTTQMIHSIHMKKWLRHSRSVENCLQTTSRAAAGCLGQHRCLTKCSHRCCLTTQDTPQKMVSDDAVSSRPNAKDDPAIEISNQLGNERTMHSVTLHRLENQRAGFVVNCYQRLRFPFIQIWNS